MGLGSGEKWGILSRLSHAIINFSCDERGESFSSVVAEYVFALFVNVLKMENKMNSKLLQKATNTYYIRYLRFVACPLYADFSTTPGGLPIRL